ncbi:ribonuclease III [Helicobacter sp. 13S00401-1]|uniref:ribonuclease III n=1 Tax=Helicobacter sp. 13S00401-1 TaxID=1905758 RepID=UPI000BA6A49B|nr:ribonuclease III [Helicobacter sp. 13S00401-1]PAF48804.1 ribonuclease III [Helicobacter sp. 13S00401-1]
MPNLDTKDLADLEKRLHYTFKDKDLLQNALSHKSYKHQNPNYQKNNERLEFLGDAVLDLFVSKILYDTFPTQQEGILSKMRTYFVNEGALFIMAEKIELSKFLFISEAEEANGGRSKPSLIADALEAVLGAIFVESGFDKAFKVFRFLFPKDLESHYKNSGFDDYKGALQELTQKLFEQTPEYVVLEESGPDHNKTFTVEVRCNSLPQGKARANTKKKAEQLAAKVAFDKLKSTSHIRLNHTDLNSIKRSTKPYKNKNKG